MFASVRNPVEALSRDFDVSQLTAGQAVAALRELASIRNVIDGLIGRVGVQVEESGAYRMRGERSAAAFVARELGEHVGDVRALLDERESSAAPRGRGGGARRSVVDPADEDDRGRRGGESG